MSRGVDYNTLSWEQAYNAEDKIKKKDSYNLRHTSEYKRGYDAAEGECYAAQQRQRDETENLIKGVCYLIVGGLIFTAVTGLIYRWLVF